MIKSIEITENMRRAVRFFPLPVFMALVLGMIGNVLILNENFLEPGIEKIVVWFMMGFFIFTWVSLHYHSVEKKSVVIAYLFALLIWGYLGYEVFYSEHTQEVIFFKSFFLTLGFILSYIYVPFLKNRKDNLKILFQIHQLRYALFRTLLFTLLLGIALSIIGGTFKFLFGVELHILLLFIGFNAMLGAFLYNFLTTLMQNPNEVSIDIEAYKAMVNRYLLWLLYTFTIIIFTALNLFVIKIIITQELPKGQIAWMVMGFSVFAFLSYLSLLPYKEKIKKYNTLLWGTLVLQSFVLLGSIFVRVYEYGVTEKRYLLVAYGLWLLGISLYFLWQKSKAKIFWLFSSLSVVVLLSQVGPINGYWVSEYSQQTRLVTIYNKFKTSQNEEKKEAFDELYDVIKYLRDTHGYESVQEVMPEFSHEQLSSFSSLRVAFDLERTMVNNGETEYVKPLSFHQRNDLLFRVEGYDYFLKGINISQYIARYNSYDGVKLTFQVNPLTLNVEVGVNEQKFEIALEPLLKRLEESNSPNKEELVLLLDNETLEMKMEFHQIHYEERKRHFTGYANVFVKLKE